MKAVMGRGSREGGTALRGHGEGARTRRTTVHLEGTQHLVLDPSHQALNLQRRGRRMQTADKVVALEWMDQGMHAKPGLAEGLWNCTAEGGDGTHTCVSAWTAHAVQSA